MTTTRQTLDRDEIKQAAQGRWPELLKRICPELVEAIDNSPRHVLCPLPEHDDRTPSFRNDEPAEGKFICTCDTFDGFELIMNFRNCGFVDAMALIAEQLGITDSSSSRGSVATADLIERVAIAKNISVGSLVSYGAKLEEREHYGQVVRIPVWNENGEQHSYFDLGMHDKLRKGMLKAGSGSSGLFLPRLPESGEKWLLVEGVKDACALHALGFNACGLPTAQMNKKYAKCFKGVDTVVVPDLDGKGIEGAGKTASRLYRIAASVRIARLPGEVKSSGGDDVRDILVQPGGEAIVRECIEKAEEFLPGVDDASRLENFTVSVDSDGKLLHFPKSMRQTLKECRDMTGNWPRRSVGTMFVDVGDRIDFIESQAALFGWIHSDIGGVDWKTGSSFFSKQDYFEEAKRTATAYDAIENFPHIPRLSGHYYACHEYSAGDGRTLQRFLALFNPQLPIDRDLILAAIMTLLWGGRGGSRPAFVITAKGRGCGKSTLVELLSTLVGGYVDFTNGEDFGQVKSRLLSNEALMKRVCLLDNVKTFKLSWAELEGLITAQTISGKKMYVGEAQRPNTLTWFLTLNGANLSKDLAQRSVIIKLDKPKHSGSWKDDAVQFIEGNREAIISDVFAEFSRSSIELAKYSRWGDWEREILSRLPDPNDAQATILERQGEVDTEAEEVSIFTDFVEEQLSRLHYHKEDNVFLPTQVMAMLWNGCFHERKTPQAVTRQINLWIEEGSSGSIGNVGRSYGRGFRWATTSDGALNVDIEERLKRSDLPWNRIGR